MIVHSKTLKPNDIWFRQKFKYKFSFKFSPQKFGENKYIELFDGKIFYCFLISPTCHKIYPCPCLIYSYTFISKKTTVRWKLWVLQSENTSKVLIPNFLKCLILTLTHLFILCNMPFFPHVCRSLNVCLCVYACTHEGSHVEGRWLLTWLVSLLPFVCSSHRFYDKQLYTLNHLASSHLDF